MIPILNMYVLLLLLGPAARSPNQNRNVTERAVPMHMLQDVYIPLTRIDAGDLQTNSVEIEAEANSDDSAEELGLGGEEQPIFSQLKPIYSWAYI